MNALAGIVIGWFNDAWSLRLVAPFVWGLVWCLRGWVTSAHRTFRLNERSAGQRWGLSDASAFYVIEYGTAVITSMFFSVAVGGLRALFG